MRRAAWWIDDRHRDEGARAIARALLAARRPWPVVGVVLLTPPVSVLAALVYRVVARHRHRLPGATVTCASPPSR